MPIYEYECANRHRFELRQSFSDEPVVGCPTCQSKSRRVIHSVAVHFKGSGFYVNDYGRKSAGETDSSKADGKDTSSESAEKGSDPATAGKKRGEQVGTEEK